MPMAGRNREETEQSPFRLLPPGNARGESDCRMPSCDSNHVFEVRDTTPFFVGAGPTRQVLRGGSINVKMNPDDGWCWLSFALCKAVWRGKGDYRSNRTLPRVVRRRGCPGDQELTGSRTKRRRARERCKGFVAVDSEGSEVSPLPVHGHGLFVTWLVIPGQAEEAPEYESSPPDSVRP